MEFILFIIAVFVILFIIGVVTSGDQNEETIHTEVIKPVIRKPSIQPKKIEVVKPSAVKNKYASNIPPSAKFLEKCIDTGDSISFTYVDADGVITDRTVTPERIFWGYSNREGGGKKIRTCWVEAYCHLRNDRRTFIKDRMSKVEIN